MGRNGPLEPADILIVTPLQRADQGHPAGAGRQRPDRVQGRDGDNFQWPGRPRLVIYSNGTSSADEAPARVDSSTTRTG